MKPIVFSMLVCSVTGVLTAAQQQPAPAPAPQPAHKVFVLNGCLATEAGAADAFRLTGATAVGQAPPARPATSTEPKDVYVLLPTTGLTEQGVARDEMKTHVGKKVEVTVRPVEVAPGPTSSSSSATTAQAREQEAPPRYTVTKIASMAGSCPHS